jgi:Flp pilus assembly protein TadD
MLSTSLRAYLLGELSPSASLVRLGELARRWSSDGLVRYLYAKRLENAWMHDEAIREIQAARTSTSPPLPEALGREAERLYGRSLFRAGRFEEASRAFRELAEAGPGAEVPYGGEMLLDADWAARADHAFRRGLE